MFDHYALSSYALTRALLIFGSWFKTLKSELRESGLAGTRFLSVITINICDDNPLALYNAPRSGNLVSLHAIHMLVFPSRAYHRRGIQSTLRFNIDERSISILKFKICQYPKRPNPRESSPRTVARGSRAMLWAAPWNIFGRSTLHKGCPFVSCRVLDQGVHKCHNPGFLGFSKQNWFWA